MKDTEAECNSVLQTEIWEVATFHLTYRTVLITNHFSYTFITRTNAGFQPLSVYQPWLALSKLRFRGRREPLPFYECNLHSPARHFRTWDACGQTCCCSYIISWGEVMKSKVFLGTLVLAGQ